MSERNGLPAGWSLTSLGEIGDYLNGRAFSKSEWSDVGRPIIRIQDLTGTGSFPNYYSGEDLEERYKVRTGDLLVSWSATLGAFVWNGPEGWLNQHIFKVISFVYTRFHYYLIRNILNELYRQTHGSGMVHITKGKFEAISVALPPLPEQHRIAAAIDEQFSRLNAGEAALERVRTNLKRYRTAVLEAAVEGRLTEAWREENADAEPASELLARMLKERRERWEKDQLAVYEEKGKKPPKNWQSKYKEPLGPAEDLPDLPVGWTWSTLEQLTWDSGYGTSQKCSYEAPGPPVLRIPNVTGGTFDLSDLKFGSRPAEFESMDLLVPNDMLVIRTNGSRNLIGRAAVVRSEFERPHYFASYLIRFRVVGILGLSEWIAAAWDAPNTRRLIEQVAATSAGQYNVNISKLSSVPIPLPPLGEQAAVMEEIKLRRSVLDEVEAEVEANLKRATRLRRSILERAFEGKLVPQDPNDEPASALLARIRAERERSSSTKRRKKGPARHETTEVQAGLF